jgi:hypothetical protein
MIDFQNNTFINNTAKIYGNNIASFPIKFGLKIYNKYNNKSLYDY